MFPTTNFKIIYIMKEKILLLVASLNAVSALSEYPFYTLVSESAIIIGGHCVRIPELFVFMNITLAIPVTLFENANNETCIRYTISND